LKKIKCYKQEHIDFIQAINILNQILVIPSKEEETDPEKINFTTFAYDTLLFNKPNIDDYSDPNNAEYRRLLGFDTAGKKELKNDCIYKLAKEFTNICLQISYTRETIQARIQQYSYIGTHKIISDVVREYFLKNFSRRSEWRFYSEFQNKETFKTLDELNRKTNRGSTWR
jgi:hypothetical protein